MILYTHCSGIVRTLHMVFVGRRFSSSSSCYRTTRFTSVHHTPARRTSSPTTETRSGSSQWPASSSPFIWARGGIQLESPRPEKSSSSGPRNCIQVLSKLLNSLPRLRLAARGSLRLRKAALRSQGSRSRPSDPPGSLACPARAKTLCTLAQLVDGPSPRGSVIAALILASRSQA